MKYLFSFLIAGVAVLVPELASADPGDLLTIADADRMTEETNTVIAVSTGAIAFFLGWVAGSSS